MNSAELSLRYAKALFAVAVENQLEEKIFSQIRELKGVFRRGCDIENFFSSQAVSEQQKKIVLSKVMEKFPQQLKGFLTTLLSNQRLCLLDEIIDLYEKQIDNKNQVCRGEVVSAIPLSQDERLSAEKKVESVLGKKVVMSYRVDPELLGGIVTKVGSFVFDDSLQSHMTKLKDQLKRSAV